MASIPQPPRPVIPGDGPPDQEPPTPTYDGDPNDIVRPWMLWGLAALTVALIIAAGLDVWHRHGDHDESAPETASIVSTAPATAGPTE